MKIDISSEGEYIEHVGQEEYKGEVTIFGQKISCMYLPDGYAFRLLQKDHELRQLIKDALTVFFEKMKES